MKKLFICVICILSISVLASNAPNNQADKYFSKNLNLTVAQKIPFDFSCCYDEDLQALFSNKNGDLIAKYLQTYGRPSAGYSIRYHNKDSFVTVFIYDSEGKTIEREMQLLLGGLKLFAQFGKYRDLVIQKGIEKGKLEISKLDYVANYCRYKDRMRGKWINWYSFSLILKKNNKLVKVRISSEKKLGAEKLDLFIKNLDAQLTASR